MKVFYRLAALVFLAISFASCEKVIDLDLKNASPQLVIEGGIINLSHVPVVRISRSVSFSEPNSFPPVKGAIVKATTGSSTIYYTEVTPGVYQGPAIIGRSGRTYSLQVDVDGKTYNASSTMPNLVAIDSLAVDEQTFQGKVTKTVVVYYTDPVNEKNQYHFVLYVNGQLVKRVFARDDQFNNGRAVRVALYQDDIELKSGDRIDIELQSVDETIFKYWYTFAKQSGNAMGDASVAPTNPVNNFDRLVLGYFSAHAVSRRMFMVN